jgi:hypothetical protein
MIEGLRPNGIFYRPAVPSTIEKYIYAVNQVITLLKLNHGTLAHVPSLGTVGLGSTLLQHILLLAERGAIASETSLASRHSFGKCCFGRAAFRLLD